MKALIFREPHQPILYRDVERPEPGPGQLLVEMKAAALNHRDVWMTQGLYPGLQPDVILGSCGAGMVAGRPVIINPNIGWGDDPAYPDQTSYQILGMPGHGTFAEYLLTAPDRLVEKPDHLTMAEAAALPLAGLTAYRALFSKARLTAADKVLINGVGGGVALLACQFAIAIGAQVYVTSSSEKKIGRALELGAKGGISYRDEKWSRRFVNEFGGVDVVIDSAGGEGFGELLKVCNPLGRIVTYGGTRGTSKLSPQVLFFKELAIYGSTMGNDAEFAAMVTMVKEYQIRPVVDAIFPLSEHEAAFARLGQGKQFGKIVFALG